VAASRRRAIGVVMGLGFLVVMGSDAVAPVLALSARGMGASSVEVGLLFASLYGVRFVIGPIVGWLSDRVGLRWTLTCCLVVGPLVPLAYALAPTFGWLVAGRLLSGVVSSAFSPIVIAYLGVVTRPGQEGRVTGTYNCVTWLGSSLGVLASGLVADRFGLRAPYLLFFLLAVVGTGVVFLVPDERRMGGQARAGEDGHTPTGPAGLAPADATLLVANLACYTNLAALMSFFPLFGVARGYSLAEIGIFMSVLGAAAASLQLVFGRLSDRVATEWLTLAGAAVLCTGYAALMLFTPFPAALGAAVTLALGLAAMQASLTTAAVVTGRQRSLGAFMGFFYSSQALGRMSGPVVSGLLAAGGSYSAVFAPAAVLALLASIAAKATARTRTHQEVPA